MKTLYTKYLKDRINELPVSVFPGKIIVISSQKAARKAVDKLMKSSILGIDSETRPSFERGGHHKVALLQVSNHEVCYLFRLNVIGVCDPIKRLLEDTTIPKIGLSLKDDMRMLHGRSGFTPGWFIELQDLAGDFGIADRSLQKLWANFFGEKLSKRQQLSNWEASPLSKAQQQYAALDAYACIRLYEEMCRVRDEEGFELLPVATPLKAPSDGGETTAVESTPTTTPATTPKKKRHKKKRKSRRKKASASEAKAVSDVEGCELVSSDSGETTAVESTSTTAPAVTPAKKKHKSRHKKASGESTNEAKAVSKEVSDGVQESAS